MTGLDTDPAAPTSLGFIRSHPLTTFFVMASALSWIAWTPYILSSNGLGVWDYRFPEVLGTAQIAGLLPGLYLGPITSAFVVTALADGRPGLRRWCSRLGRWRVGRHWYALALLGVPAAMLVAGAAFSGGDVRAPTALALAAYAPGLVLQMLTTGIGEEPGWRDFALPRLQSQLGPLRAVFVLGPLWGVWHLPLFLTDWGGWPNAHWSRPLVFLVFCVAFSVVLSWVFNRTGESLPIAMLMHVSVNNFASILWADVFPSLDAERAMVAMTSLTVITAAVVLVGTRGRLGYGGEPGGPQPHLDRRRTIGLRE
ncbi:MAG: CPBP family intramembrane metalloprotease [Mycolicibacterium sp.]|nr:CPBP family intramembrane metalloprotease [Mycolicibacterium sp.]